MARRTRWTKTEMELKIEQTRGNLAAIGRFYGVDRTTIYRYIQRHPKLMEARDSAREAMLDEAENILYQKILQGSTAELIFFLKTQGYKRGYIERHEQTGADGGPMRVRIEIVRSDDPDDTSTFTPMASWTAISDSEPEAVQRPQLGAPVRENGSGNGASH